MNHLSIEGFDGVGKTTTARLVADKLGYLFIEKPLHELFDEGDSFEEYIRIRDKVNASPDRDFTSLFYGLGSVYMYGKHRDENIVTDRHLCSNYAWSGTYYNMDVYDFLIEKLDKPTLTIILHAKPKTIQKRLQGRDAHDNDLRKVQKSPLIYSKMERFCKEKSFETLCIETDGLSPEAIAEVILERYAEIMKKNGEVAEFVRYPKESE